MEVDSGGFMLFKIWRGELAKRVRSLLVPFLLWCVIGVCICSDCSIGGLGNV